VSISKHSGETNCRRSGDQTTAVDANIFFQTIDSTAFPELSQTHSDQHLSFIWVFAPPLQIIVVHSVSQGITLKT